MHNGGWTNKQMDLLKQLASTGLNSTEIATKMKRTRGSIIGFMYRHKIPLLSAEKGFATKIGHKSKKTREVKKPAKKVVPVEKQEPEVMRQRIEAPKNIAGTALDATKCCAVIGDARNMVYCGEPVTHKGYCFNHASAYIQGYGK